MKRSSKIIFSVFIALSIAGIILWQYFVGSNSYYLCAVIVIALSLLPFFISFEKSFPSAREMALMAVLIALAVASRAVFYLIPQFKPIGAVVIACAVCLGAERGYIIGAFSAFISNFLFGQGAWTPFQMAALGLCGFLAGLIFKRIKADKWTLSVVGFVLTFAVYGLIADASTVLITVTKPSLASVGAVYAAGLPFSAVFGAATAVFLFLFGEVFIKKINRIIVKYGIGEDNYEE